VLEAYAQAEGIIPPRQTDICDMPGNLIRDEKPGTVIVRCKLPQKIGEGAWASFIRRNRRSRSVAA
jgi:hypothetical protein